MAVKRRIVWLSDEEWDDLGAIAKAQKMTISAVVRDMIEQPIRGERIAAEAFGKRGIVGAPEFRPVPKPGSKR